MGDETWALPPHSEAKHIILRKYLDAWFPIMGQSREERLLYIDGFAGPGNYDGGEPGSPIIALSALLDHPKFPSMSSKKFTFVFIEGRSDRHATLEKNLAAYASTLPGGKFPSNVRVLAQNDTFLNVLNGLTASIPSRRLVPTLAFIDPFGWKDVPLESIARMLDSDKCEVLFNFMSDSINRFLSHPLPAIAQQFEELFGCALPAAIAALSGEPRRRALHDLYERQLRTVGNFTYVRGFDMYNMQGHLSNRLFFGTRNKRGLECMKDAMWKVNAADGSTFRDITAGIETLFAEEPDYSALAQQILDQFTGRDVTIDDIRDWVNTDTGFRKTHTNGAVARLVNDGKLIEPTRALQRYQGKQQFRTR